MNIEVELDEDNDMEHNKYHERRGSYSDVLKRIETIEHLIRGDGQTGLVTQIELIKRDGMEIKSYVEALRNDVSLLSSSVNELRLQIEVERSRREAYEQRGIDMKFVVERIVVPIAIPLISGAIWATAYILIQKGGSP